MDHTRVQDKCRSFTRDVFEPLESLKIGAADTSGPEDFHEPVPCEPSNFASEEDEDGGLSEFDKLS